MSRERAHCEYSPNLCAANAAIRFPYFMWKHRHTYIHALVYFRNVRHRLNQIWAKRTAFRWACSIFLNQEYFGSFVRMWTSIKHAAFSYSLHISPNHRCGIRIFFGNLEIELLVFSRVFIVSFSLFISLKFVMHVAVRNDAFLFWDYAIQGTMFRLVFVFLFGAEAFNSCAAQKCRCLLSNFTLECEWHWLVRQ